MFTLKHVKASKRSVILFGIILSLVLGLFTTFMNPQPAHAAVSKNSTPTEKATAYYYAHGLVQCALHGYHNANVAKWDAESGNIFNSMGGDPDDVWGVYGNAIGSGAKDGGQVDCGDNKSQTMRHAASVFGVTPLELICGIKAIEPSDGSKGMKCGDKNVDNYIAKDTTASNVMSFLRTKLGFDPSVMDGATRYIYSLDSMKASCTKGRYPSAKSPGGKAFKIKAPDGKDAYYVYNKDFDSNTKVKYKSNPQTKWQCKDIVDSVNKSNAAYVAWQKQNGNNDKGGSSNDSTTDGEDEASKCQIDGIGWILCPVVNFLADTADFAYDWLKKFFVIDGKEYFDTGGSAYQVWTQIRNLANAFFVLAFLIIIFSYVSNIGISAYNIKKMMPKIIISAILINTSFIICTLAVDLSNIIGVGIEGFFSSVGVETSSKPSFGSGGSAAGWVGAAELILGGGGAVALGMLSVTALVSLLAAVVLAAVAVIVVLVVREALIILLVVISPLAFAAYLLPNTESWLKRWFSFFKVMLFMFPVIALIFGASSVASKIITTSGQASDDLLVQMLGAAVAVIPLFITPLVMKTAGGFLNKIGGFVNNPNRGPFDKLKKHASTLDNYNKSRRRGNAMNPNSARTRAGKAWRKVAGKPSRVMTGWRGGMAAAGNRARAAEARADADAVQGSQQKYFDKVKDGKITTPPKGVEAAIRGQLQSVEQKDVQDVEAKISLQNVGELKDTLEKAFTANDGQGDLIAIQAARNRLATKGNAGINAIEEVATNLDKDGLISNDARKEFAGSMPGDVLGKSEVLKKYATSTDSSGEKGMSMADAHNAALQAGATMSPEKFMKQTPTMQKEILSSGSTSGAVLDSVNDPKNAAVFEGTVSSAMKAEQQVQGGGKVVVDLEEQHSNNGLKPPTQDEISRAVNDHIKNQSSATTNNSQPTEIKITHDNAPSTPPSSAPKASPAPKIDNSGRQTPGSVSNPGDYHDRMSK